MKSHVRKWGNSLAVRIPSSFAAEAGLKADSPVDLALVEGALVVRPAPRPRVTLADLLAEVSEENVHREVDAGDPVGGEEW